MSTYEQLRRYDDDAADADAITNSQAELASLLEDEADRVAEFYTLADWQAR